MQGNDCRTNARVSNDDNAYFTKLLHMISEFQQLWDGHLGQIRTGKYRTELGSADEIPIGSAPFQPCPLVWYLGNHEIDKMQAMNLIDVAQTYCAAPSVVIYREAEHSHLAWNATT